MQTAEVVSELRLLEEPSAAATSATDATDQETAKDTEVLDFAVTDDDFAVPLLLRGRSTPGLPPQDEWGHTGFPPPADLDDF